MAGDVKSRTPAARKTGPRPRTTHVFAVPVVELFVGPKCSHGCFVVTSTMPTVWHFEGIGDSIEVGPGAQQPDLLVHSHTGDESLLDDDCESCWESEE